MWDFASQPVKVLIVDDNVDTAESLACLLQTCGHEIRVAHSGGEAITRAKEFAPDAILLDLRLPDMDGYEVASRLRSSPEFAQTILIAATGNNRERDRVRAAAVGFDHFLVKPFSPFSLNELVDPCAVSA